MFGSRTQMTTHLCSGMEWSLNLMYPIATNTYFSLFLQAHSSALQFKGLHDNNNATVQLEI